MTDEQKTLQKIVRNFVEKDVLPRAAEYDLKGELDRTSHQKACDMGLHTIAVPEEYGGPGMSYQTQAIIIEELHKGDAGLAIALGTQALASRPAYLFGSEEQKKFVFDRILDGQFGAFCLTEANAGSDPAAIRTTARKSGDEYILNGSKSFITNGPLASFFTVFAITDKEKGTRGITAFLVDKETSGLSVGKKEDKMGLRQSETSDVIFEDVKVPVSSVIGKENHGFKIAMSILNYGRIDVAAGAVGIAQKAIDLCVEYAKERVTFGKPIARHQAVQFMLADMEIQTEASRALVWQAASLVDAGQLDPIVCACAKTMASDTAMKVTTDAVQIFSGYGYSREYPVEKLMRDAKIYQIFEGTNQIQRMVIGGGITK
jgi:butyryl-CoA dehydrogenase